MINFKHFGFSLAELKLTLHYCRWFCICQERSDQEQDQSHWKDGKSVPSSEARFVSENAAFYQLFY